MADINWEPFISTRAHKASQALPQITISKDNGRISLNATACELIPGFYSLKYAEVYCGSIEGKLKKIRLQFTNRIIVTAAEFIIIWMIMKMLKVN